VFATFHIVESNELIAFVGISWGATSRRFLTAITAFTVGFLTFLAPLGVFIAFFQDETLLVFPTGQTARELCNVVRSVLVRSGSAQIDTDISFLHAFGSHVGRVDNDLSGVGGRVAAVGIATHFMVADSACGVGHSVRDLFYRGVPKNFVNFVRICAVLHRV
jgi:hypothetical protein